MPYTPTAWVNGTTPAINATNLNKMETELARLKVNADLDPAAAIAYSKLNLASSIVSADIVDGTLVNADINASAAIAGSKLATGASGPPGSLIAYAEFTSAVNMIVGTNTEASPLDAVSAGAISFDGATSVKVEFWCPRGVLGASSGAQIGVNLWDGTDLGRFFFSQNNAATVLGVSGLYGVRYLTPSNASHTYKARAWATGSNGSLNPGAGGVATELPGFIRITKA